MVKNMGNLDRGVRAVVGVALIVWGVAIGNWLGALGIIPLLTSMVGWCPAYLPFGWKTCRTRPQSP